MYPILFNLGPMVISSFGFFLSLAFVLGSFFILREARRENMEEEKVLDTLLATLITAVIFSRFFYILLNFSQFGFNPFNWILVNAKPGFYFYGGFWVSILFFRFFVEKFKLSFKRTADIFTYGLIIALILISFGSFLDGSDVGVKTNLPWGVYFVGVEGKRHPVQIYSLFFLIFSLYIFLRVKKVYYEKNIIPGTLSLVFLTIFGISQLVLEFFRESKVYLRGVNLNQTISLITFLASSLLLYRMGSYRLNDLRQIINKRFFKFFKKGEKL